MTQPYATRAQGVHGSGARSYKPEQAERVRLILLNECVGRLNKMTAETLADRVGLPGRALRDVISDLEKAGRVLTNFGDGYFVCETVEEAEESTHRLRSQVRNMTERIDARDRMSGELEELQRRLL